VVRDRRAIVPGAEQAGRTIRVDRPLTVIHPPLNLAP
jgi:hypothetical protein